jgi:alpha-L-fucosidase 2
MQTRREFFATIPAAIGAANALAQSAADHNLVLWYKQPAEIWTDALPVGNGRLGAMVFGGHAFRRLAARRCRWRNIAHGRQQSSRGRCK